MGAQSEVSKAAEEDADDKESAEAGYARATLLIFVPDVENGHPAKLKLATTCI